MKITEKELLGIIKECIISSLNESDRHREGYYKDYAEKTGKKDRHRADYYKEYREKKKREAEHKDSNNTTPQKTKKDRREYYHKYNQEHPERLNRGFTRGYVNGNVDDGPIETQNNQYWTDELGRVHSNDFFNPTFSDLLQDKLEQWHDDDWYEGMNDEDCF